MSRGGGHAPEVWGGLECTVNRVGERYFDQCRRSGHNARPGDIDRFAALGIRAFRYPVLWETTASDGPKTADWAQADERLEQRDNLLLTPVEAHTFERLQFPLDDETGEHLVEAVVSSYL